MTTTTTDSIPVRKPRLDWSGSIDRFYLDGNPIKTHFFNALNLLFPDGERFFVKSVHDHAQEIQDPALLCDMRAFAGQEGQHARQHELFFSVLERQGYALEPLLGPFRKLERWSNKLPRALRLSITAGAEHYTATMAAIMLEHDMLSECDDTVRSLIKWHAIEEIEHKHVAYDVLAQLHPYNYPLRILGFLIASLAIAGFTFAGLRMLLIQDGRSRRMTRVQYETARAALTRSKERGFRRAVRKHLLRYFVPGFHPNQQNDRPLLARFTPEITQVLGD